jgi:acyl-CoA hydrolase
VDFLKPVYVGSALVLNARLTYVGKSSMEVEVKVESEDLVKGTRTITGTAFVTAVALDKQGKPIQVSSLDLITDEDRKKFEQGKKRMEQRKKERASY